jgi:hypothetical protein
MIKSWVFAAVCAFLVGPVAFAEDAPKTWDEWAAPRPGDSAQPVVQARQVSKAGRFQIVGPLVGISTRQDFYTTYLLSFAGRYHFTERSAWEFVQLDFSFPSATGIANDIQNQTSYHPDVQLSHFQIGTAYVYTSCISIFSGPRARACVSPTTNSRSASSGLA